MAKLADAELIKRMTVYARKRADMDLAVLLHDSYQRCPGCARSFHSTKGEARIHFGEKFCGECVEGFQVTFDTYKHTLGQEIKNT